MQILRKVTWSTGSEPKVYRSQWLWDQVFAKSENFGVWSFNKEFNKDCQLRSASLSVGDSEFLQTEREEATCDWLARSSPGVFAPLSSSHCVLRVVITLCIGHFELLLLKGKGLAPSACEHSNGCEAIIVNGTKCILCSHWLHHNHSVLLASILIVSSLYTRHQRG